MNSKVNIFLALIWASLIFQSCVPAKNTSKKALASAGKSLKVGAVSSISSMVNETASENLDSSTPNCQAAVLLGWKCLFTTVSTSEGHDYKILIKWNRPNMSSRGTMLMAVGGAGVGESRLDEPSKQMMDDLSTLDQLRTIQLEFTDAATATNKWGGYWQHFGGYKSAGLAFTAAVELIISKNIIRGNFLNYLGGSNASTVMAYSMSHFNLDRYFDRVVFQMGPFLPDLAHACDPKSASSFYINSPDQQKSVFDLINFWTNGDSQKSVCDSNSDTVSILKGGKNDFPNTHVHVIVGADEPTKGFGPWILASNLEWYQGITAKSKSRIIRAGMGHNNSYVDMRRFLKLAPDDVPEVDATCADSKGVFCSGSKNVDWVCRGCGQIESPIEDLARGVWNSVGNGCYHRATSLSCKTCSQGSFCNGNKIVDWACDCSVSGAGWVSVGNNCFHKETQSSCQ